MANEGAGGFHRVQGEGHRCLPERPDGWVYADRILGESRNQVKPPITRVNPGAKALRDARPPARR